MKTIWKGSISFGLVTIPVELYPTIRTHSLGFNLLCQKCHTRITYKDWCAKCKKFVTWDGIVKGLKIEKDKYFVITKEKLRALKAHKTDTITRKEFVDADQLELVYFGQHYYLKAAAGHEKVYILFKKTLASTKKVGIGQFVMRDKEYICVITPQEESLILSTLHYAYEIRQLPSTTAVSKQPKISAQELKLAQQLINKMSKKTFKLEAYKDTFAQDLAKAIKKSKKVSIMTTDKEQPMQRKQKKKGEEELVPLLQKSIRQPSATYQPTAYASTRKRSPKKYA